MTPTRRRPPNAVIGVVFSIIATVSFVIAAALAWQLHVERRDWVHAQAKVVGFNRRCNPSGQKCGNYPIVNFDAGGATIGVTGKVGNAGLDEGDVVDVLYPDGDPHAAVIDHWGQSGFGIAFGLFFTLVFGAFGYPALLGTIARRSGAAWARQHGTPVQARVTEVMRDTRTRVNGRSPYRIVSQWQSPRDGRVHEFVSDAMWSDPAERLKGREFLTVKVDPAQPLRYWIDLDFLSPPG